MFTILEVCPENYEGLLAERIVEINSAATALCKVRRIPRLSLDLAIYTPVEIDTPAVDIGLNLCFDVIEGDMRQIDLEKLRRDHILADGNFMNSPSMPESLLVAHRLGKKATQYGLAAFNQQRYRSNTQRSR